MNFVGFLNCYFLEAWWNLDGPKLCRLFGSKVKIKLIQSWKFNIFRIKTFRHILTNECLISVVQINVNYSAFISTLPSSWLTGTTVKYF